MNTKTFFTLIGISLFTLQLPAQDSKIDTQWLKKDSHAGHSHAPGEHANHDHDHAGHSLAEDKAKSLEGHADEACKTACESKEAEAKKSHEGHSHAEGEHADHDHDHAEHDHVEDKAKSLEGHADEACKTACESEEAEAKKVDPHAGHDHAPGEGHDDNEKKEPVISSHALKNLNVKFQTLKKAEQTVYTRIPAVVRSPAKNHQVLYSPWSGRVKSIATSIGQKAEADKVLVEIIRDPLPRVELRMTENILKLASEEFHTSLGEYKKAAAVLKIYKAELKRLTDFQKQADSDAPIVPRKEIINLKYEVTKAEQDFKNTEEKLLLHGSSEKDLARIQKGEELHVDHSFWLNSLKANGLWSKQAQKLFNTLPKKVQTRSWIIPSIAELSAEDFISDKLIATVKQNKTLAQNFIEAAGLIQQGYSVEQLVDLTQQQAFQKIMKLSFPTDADVTKINIRRGQRIEIGAELISLRDPSLMYLEVQALGSEKAEVKKALKEKWSVIAQALTDKSIKSYKSLTVSHLQEDSTGSRLLKAIVPIKNRLLSENKRDKSVYRSWELQDGLRFYLQVPRAVHKNAFEVPASAVLDSGSDKIVIVKEGETYYERPVHIVYSNDDRAILSAASELRPNEQVVSNGAFALQLALQKSKGLVIDTRCAHGGH